MMKECIFCQKIVDKNFILENKTAISFRDKFPLTDGHTLIIPKRHEKNFFNLKENEQQDVLKLMNLSKNELLVTLKPSGFNIGVNIGESGGQTIDHAHMHLIPRYKGDVKEPMGGVRWIIPDKAPYWQ